MTNKIYNLNIKYYLTIYTLKIIIYIFKLQFIIYSFKLPIIFDNLSISLSNIICLI
jgi:hypothetical protein